MCLGIPGKLIEIWSEHGMSMAKVDFGGISKKVCLAFTPQARTGEYVIVHVGFALQVIDEAEALQVFSFLESLDELDELKSDHDEVNTESGASPTRADSSSRGAAG